MTKRDARLNFSMFRIWPIKISLSTLFFYFLTSQQLPVQDFSSLSHALMTTSQLTYEQKGNSKKQFYQAIMFWSYQNYIFGTNKVSTFRRKRFWRRIRWQLRWTQWSTTACSTPSTWSRTSTTPTKPPNFSPRPLSEIYLVKWTYNISGLNSYAWGMSVSGHLTFKCISSTF